MGKSMEYEGESVPGLEGDIDRLETDGVATVFRAHNLLGDMMGETGKVLLMGSLTTYT